MKKNKREQQVERKKKSLFADGMIVYRKNTLKESIDTEGVIFCRQVYIYKSTIFIINGHKRNIIF